MVRSRSAREASAPTHEWVGHNNGTFTIAQADSALDAPGTEVVITARSSSADLVGATQVRRIAAEFGSLLPYDITLCGYPSPGDRLAIAPHPAPWEQPAGELVEYCRTTFGFTPLDIVPINLPVAQVRGVAFVLSHEARPGSRPGDTVYLNRMLLSRNNLQLVPEWAFFVRVVIDAGDLPPTASREELRSGGLLTDARHAVGVQLAQHIERMAIAEPALFAHFSETHHTGLIAMASSQDNILSFVFRHLPVSTTLGTMPLAALAERAGTIDYVLGPSDFRLIEPVARAQDIGVLDAQYAFYPGMLDRLASWRSDLPVREVAVAEIVQRLPEPAADQLAQVASTLAAARAVLAGDEVIVDARAFEPTEMSAIWIPRDELRDPGEAGDGWDDVLAGLDAPDDDSRARLVLNVRSPLLRAAATAPRPVQDATIRGLHAMSVLNAGLSLDGDTARELAASLGVLVERASRQADSTEER